MSSPTIFSRLGALSVECKLTVLWNVHSQLRVVSVYKRMFPRHFDRNCSTLWTPLCTLCPNLCSALWTLFVTKLSGLNAEKKHWTEICWFNFNILQKRHCFFSLDSTLHSWICTLCWTVFVNKISGQQSLNMDQRYHDDPSGSPLIEFHNFLPSENIWLPNSRWNSVRVLTGPGPMNPLGKCAYFLPLPSQS